MARTPYQQALDLLDRLTRDEKLNLIAEITGRLREVAANDIEPERDDPESEGRTRKNYPRLATMLEWGAIQLRDTLYVDGHENDAVMLLDAKTVAYRGQEMQINDWACQVAGWQSISIYRHVYVKRLGQTLGQVRKQYMEDHNMPNPG